MFEGLARAVRPGGTLLFSAHALPSSETTTTDRPAIAALYFTPRDVVQHLSHGHWDILFASEEPRVTHTHDGRGTDLDTLVNARRIA